jgi:hypothetical protein
VNLRLDWCSYQAAKYAVENWHYSRSMPTPPNIKIGVWENLEFIGALIFSRGNSTNLGTAYNLSIIEVCELARVALKTHKTTVTKILSIAVSMLKIKEKKLRLIVSFADANQRHLGIIYQAANWIYYGKTIGGYKFRKDGKEYHSRQVASDGIKIQFGQKRNVPRIEDCERIKQLPKFRYLFPLDKQMRRQIEPLAKPYPKRLTSIVSDAPDVPVGNEGGANPTVRLNHAGRIVDG